MAKIEAWLSCDLKKPVQVQGLSGNVFSMDNNGSRINVRIYDNGEKTTVSGSVTANCILADGSTINVNGSLTTDNGQSVAYVDIPQSCLLVPGPIRIAIKLTASGVITTLAAVVTTVYRTQTDIVVTPSQQIINDWNAEISAAIATQNAAIANQDTKINDLKSALKQQYNYNVDIVRGYYAVADGSIGENDNWCRTNGFINKDVIIKTSTINMWLVAYHKNTGEYIGGWNGTEFSTTFTDLTIKEYNIGTFVKNYPNYVFAVDFKKPSRTLLPSDVYSEMVIEYSKHIDYKLEGKGLLTDLYTGTTIIGDFPVIAGHTYEIFIKSLENSGASNVRLGLGSNGYIDLTSAQLYAGYTWTKVATVSSGSARVYCYGTSGTPVEILAEIRDITDPYSLAGTKLRFKDSYFVDLYEIFAEYEMYATIDSNGVIGYSSYNHITPLIPVKSGDVLHYYLMAASGNSLISFYKKSDMSVTQVAAAVDDHIYVKGDYTFNADGYIRILSRNDNGVSYGLPDKNAWVRFDNQENKHEKKSFGHYYNRIKDGVTTIVISAPVEGFFETRFYDSSYQYIGKGANHYNKLESISVKAESNPYLSSDPEFVEFLENGVAISGDKIVTMGVERNKMILDADQYCSAFDDISVSNGQYTDGIKLFLKPDCFFELNGEPLVVSTVVFQMFVRFYDKDFMVLGNLNQLLSYDINVSESTIKEAGAKYVKVCSISDRFPVNLFAIKSGIKQEIIIRKTTNTNDIHDIPNIQYVGALAGLKQNTSGSQESRRINCLNKHKYFTIGFITDTHGDIDRFDRFVNLMNHADNSANYDSNRGKLFDCAIHGGDALHGSIEENPGYFYNGVAVAKPYWFNEHAEKINIPLINTIGNHDTGWTTSIGFYTDEQLYNYYISKTSLKNNNKQLYGYLDFEDYKIRVINLYDFDSNLAAVVEEKDLSSLPFNRGFDKMYSQDQIDWLCETLDRTPANYTVIIVSHTQQIYKNGEFSYVEGFTSSTHGDIGDESYTVYGHRQSDGGGMGVILDIVKAWKNRETIDETYKYVGNRHMSSSYDYFDDISVNYDFSQSNGEFGFFLGGHLHECMAVKATVTGYEGILQITGTTGSCENYQQVPQDDLRKVINTSMQDAILGIVVNTNNKTVSLVNLGTYVNESGNEKKCYTISYDSQI